MWYLIVTYLYLTMQGQLGLAGSVLPNYTFTSKKECEEVIENINNSVNYKYKYNTSIKLICLKKPAKI